MTEPSNLPDNQLTGDDDEINLLDLATHHSGLPAMPDNTGPGNVREKVTNYRASDLYAFIKRHGLGKPTDAHFLYSNLGFTVLGAALAKASRSHAGVWWRSAS